MLKVYKYKDVIMTLEGTKEDVENVAKSLGLLAGPGSNGPDTTEDHIPAKKDADTDDRSYRSFREKRTFKPFSYNDLNS
jgi:hypothetical protein